MLSRSHSPVNCRRRIVKGNFTHNMNFHYYCHFSGTEFMRLPDSVEGLPSQGQGGGEIVKIAYVLESYIGTDD